MKSWPTKVIEISKYHHDHANRLPKIRLQKWTLQNTANDLGLSIGYVSQALRLASAIEFDKSLIRLTMKEALERIKG